VPKRIGGRRSLGGKGRRTRMDPGIPAWILVLALIEGPISYPGGECTDWGSASLGVAFGDARVLE
jgi:hypothetical protein